jgi:DNA-binding NarL/FixJ family response regulator
MSPFPSIPVTRVAIRLRCSFDAPLSLLLAGPLEITFSPKGSVMFKTFRVLVANKPKLMRELLLETLAEQSWIEIVGEVTEEADIPHHVQKTSPDLLVVTAEEPGTRPTICDSLLREYPELRIIAVAPHENYTVCYWASLDIHSGDIESSEEGLLAAVRNMAENQQGAASQ